MDKKESLVSVLLPCYNHEKYVESCLRSIIAQTYKNIELIICDDCSSDSSYEIVLSMKDELEKRFAKIKIFKNDLNLGLTKNLNKMIKISEGDYIKLLATDDMLKSDAIENLVVQVKGNDASIVYGNVFLMNEDMQFCSLNDKICKPRYNKVMPSGIGLTSELCENCFISAPGVLFRRKLFEKYGLFDENLSFEDWEFYLRVAPTEKIVYLNEIVAYYRVCSSSMCHFNGKADMDRHEKYHREKMLILQRYGRYYNKRQIEMFYDREFLSAIRIGNDILIQELCNDIKNLKLKLTKKTQLSYVLYKVHLFNILKKIKNMCRKCIYRVKKQFY